MKCKSDLRAVILARRNALTPDQIACRSAAAAGHLLSLPEFAAATTVMFFITFGSEVDTLPALRAALASDKRALAPRADPHTKCLTPCEIRDPVHDLAVGAHGIREPRPHCPPLPLDQVDVVLVPAAVWGEDGYRLGYGGGYYDRFLPRVGRALRVGFGLEVQVVPEVPHGDRDLPVDALVTESGVRRFACPGARRVQCHQTRSPSTA